MRAAAWILALTLSAFWQATQAAEADKSQDMSAISVDGTYLPQRDADATLKLGPAEYPPDILAKSEEGTVRLAAAINANGKVTSAVVVHSSGYQDLDAATLEYVKDKAHFVAAQLNGRPTGSMILLQVIWSPASSADVQPTQPPQTSEANRVKVGSVILYHDAIVPSSSQLDGIKLLASDLKSRIADGALAIQLEGYGGAAGNKSVEAREISLERARAVRDLLVDDGVPAEKIELLPMGGITDDGDPDRVDIYARLPD